MPCCAASNFTWVVEVRTTRITEWRRSPLLFQCGRVSRVLDRVLAGLFGFVVTSVVRLAISLAADAVSATLRAISAVAAACSSTAAAIEPAMALISPIVCSIRMTAATETPVALRTSPMCWAISSVDRAVWVASAFTSDATTAKPLPASPARAASMVAFRPADWSWPQFRRSCRQRRRYADLLVQRLDSGAGFGACGNGATD